MKIKTSELIGTALDWAVAECEKQEVYWNEDDQFLGCGDGEPNFMGSRGDLVYDPSTNWAYGGPIIDNEQIMFRWVVASPSERGMVGAYFRRGGTSGITGEGSTHLIAAMRCYVAYKLGDEVDVPENLISEVVS